MTPVTVREVVAAFWSLLSTDAGVWVAALLFMAGWSLACVLWIVIMWDTAWARKRRIEAGECSCKWLDASDAQVRGLLRQNTRQALEKMIGQGRDTGQVA
jgi:hypothetical protein